MNKPFDWDVFLSHSSIDKSRVARLAERLTAAGFRVWVDRPNIDSGEDIVTESFFSQSEELREPQIEQSPL